MYILFKKKKKHTEEVRETSTVSVWVLKLHVLMYKTTDIRDKAELCRKKSSTLILLSEARTLYICKS